MSDKVFWMRTHDAPGERLPTSVAGRSERYQQQSNAPQGGVARKTRLATFYGSSFVSERGENGELHIYHIGTSMLPTDTVGDRAPPCGCGSSLDSGRMTSAKLQEKSEKLRASGVWGR